jgi:hypothetical protein
MWSVASDGPPNVSNASVEERLDGADEPPEQRVDSLLDSGGVKQILNNFTNGPFKFGQ